MILWQRLIGCVAVVGRLPHWDRYFDLSKAGLKVSFVSQIFVLPTFYYIALVATRARADLLGQTEPMINLGALIIIGLIYLLSFSAVAYILTMFFDKQNRLRPWVIIRHWCVFFLGVAGALGFALFTVGLLPLAAAYGVLFAAYMGLLFIDIRLGQRVVEFDLGGAILAACLISITGLSLLLTGVSQLV